jgi:hypothetical protein
MEHKENNMITKIILKQLKKKFKDLQNPNECSTKRKVTYKRDRNFTVF